MAADGEELDPAVGRALGAAAEEEQNTATSPADPGGAKQSSSTLAATSGGLATEELPPPLVHHLEQYLANNLKQTAATVEQANANQLTQIKTLFEQNKFNSVQVQGEVAAESFRRWAAGFIIGGAFVAACVTLVAMYETKDLSIPRSIIIFAGLAFAAAAFRLADRLSLPLQSVEKIEQYKADARTKSPSGSDKVVDQTLKIIDASGKAMENVARAAKGIADPKE